MPTSPAAADGDVTEPSVSVPMATAQQFAAAADPDPELEPDGVRSSAYGLRVCPPRPLQPLDECVERKFAHSLRFVLPRITAPAARSRSATNESRAAMLSASASEPAVVCIRSAVSMLSLISTGMPCSGPRTFPALPLGVQLRGDRERVGIELDHCVDRRPALVDCVDARQVLCARATPTSRCRSRMRACRSVDRQLRRARTAQLARRGRCPRAVARRAGIRATSTAMAPATRRADERAARDDGSTSARPVAFPRVIRFLIQVSDEPAPERQAPKGAITVTTVERLRSPVGRFVDEAADVALIADAGLEHDEQRVVAPDGRHRRVEAVVVDQLLDVLGRDVREHCDTAT